MSNHQTIHIEQKLFKCNVVGCNYQSGLESDVKKHYDTTHDAGRAIKMRNVGNAVWSSEESFFSEVKEVIWLWIG